MCLSPFCLKGLILRFLLVSWVLVLTACGGGGSSSIDTVPEDNKGGISLPQGLKTDLPANGVLNAYIIVDGGERQLMTINGDNAEISLTNVTEGEHNYIIEFEFILDTNGQDPLLLARAEKNLLVGPGVNPLNVADTDYDTISGVGLDFDNDDISNLEELANNTSPFAGFRTRLQGNTTETGDTAQYTVVLTRRPADTVTINLSSSNVNEGILDRNILVFTVDNWDEPQLINVTGVDDLVTDGNAIYAIVLNSVVSNDFNYNGEVFADVAVINIDDDTAGYNVSPISGNTDENGRTATFTVQLNKPPIAGSRVRINVSSSDTSEGTVNITRLRFTEANWDTPQTVTVTGQDDNIDDDFQVYTIILAAAISQDPAYSGLKPNDVSVTNLDNDGLPEVSFDVSETSIAENGGRSVLTASLNIASAQDVTVTFSYSGTATINTDYTVDTVALLIPAGQLSALRTMTAVQDNQVELDETIDIIIASVTGAQISAAQPLRQVIIRGGDFSVGGNIAGLSANDVVVLQNNGTNDLTITANGSFTFATRLANGGAYNVTLQTPPVNKNCVIQNASGTINGADVTNLIVNCFELDLINATPGSKRVSLTGNLIGADAYNIYYSTVKRFDIANAQGVANNVTTSPVVIDNLLNGTAYYFVLEMEFGAEKVLLPEISSRPNEWAFDGPVNAMAADTNGTLYLGGNFTSVGTYMGANIPLNDATGELAWGDFPLVDGSIFATLPDGVGGWYMGGDFIRVGGVESNNLVHILSNKTVDLNWNPNVTGVVNSLGLEGNTLYIGGDFTSVGGVLRQNLAAVVAGNNVNATVTSWNPDSNGVVNAIEVNAGVIYVGGAFTAIGTDVRNRLAALDSTGAVLTWNPDANGIVNSLIIDATVTPNLIYVGGEFTNIGSTIRNRVASIETNGSLTSWDPSADGTVNALAIDSGLVYIGGLFNNIKNALRINLAAVSSATASNLSTWNPSANNMDGPVNAIAVNANGVYVGGGFNTVGGQNKRNLVHVGLNGTIDTGYPEANAQVSSLAIDESTLYVGGLHLTSIGLITRNYLASINTNSTLSGWNPNANGQVNALVINANIVYVGGVFTSVLGSPRNQLAAMNTGTVATLDVWNPDANGTVNALAIDTSTSTVYAGGVFTALSGANHVRLAAIGIGADGVLETWTPVVDSDVNTIAIDGSNIYIGGAFSSITDNTSVSVVRNRAAVIDTAGALGAWNPDADANVNTLAVDGTTVYIGGDFATLNTSTTPLTRNRLAAISTADGTVTGWNPDADLPVRTLLIDAGLVYVGGDFTTIGGTSRASHLAAIATNGALNSWSPDVRLFPEALAIDGTTIYVGGLSEFSNGFVTTGTDGVVR